MKASSFLAGLVGALWAAAALLQCASASGLDVEAGALEYWAFDGPGASPSPIPALCGDSLNYDKVVYGTPGDDVLIGGNHSHVLIGMGGNDKLYAGTQGDCLVGGEGNDELYGDNAKDVLLGGAGDDLLNGGNSPDYLEGGDGDDRLDGGNGPDTCVGGGGHDTIVNCEVGSRAPPATTLTTVDEGATGDPIEDDTFDSDAISQGEGQSADQDAAASETDDGETELVDEEPLPTTEPADVTDPVPSTE